MCVSCSSKLAVPCLCKGIGFPYTHIFVNFHLFSPDQAWLAYNNAVLWQRLLGLHNEVFFFIRPVLVFLTSVSTRYLYKVYLYWFFYFATNDICDFQIIVIFINLYAFVRFYGYNNTVYDKNVLFNFYQYFFLINKYFRKNSKSDKVKFKK